MVGADDGIEVGPPKAGALVGRPLSTEVGTVEGTFLLFFEMLVMCADCCLVSQLLVLCDAVTDRTPISFVLRHRFSKLIKQYFCVAKRARP